MVPIRLVVCILSPSIIELQCKLDVARPLRLSNLAEIRSQHRIRDIVYWRIGEIEELGSELNPPLVVDWEVFLEAEVSAAKARSPDGAVAASPKRPRRWCVIGRRIKPLKTAIRSIMTGTENVGGTAASGPRPP